MKIKRATLRGFITYAVVIIAFIICQQMISAGRMTSMLKGQLVPICAYIIMAVSLNLVVGISGELSLGHAGFMSVGAFTGIIASAWLTAAFGVENAVVRLILSVFFGAVIAGILGALIGIPVLRLRGDYLAIVTLAFGEIIRSVLNYTYCSLDGTQVHIAFALGTASPIPVMPGKTLLNGASGSMGIKMISTFTMGFVLILFTLVVVQNLVNSRSGRAIMAVRDNRIAAEATGINATKYKMMAFVTSAALAGMAGAFYGLGQPMLKPDIFAFTKSIDILVFVVLGGLGNILGSIIAATLLTVLPEVLRNVTGSDYRMLVYAIVLILIMLATNNPTMRAFFARITGNLRGIFRRKRDDETKGGEQA